MLNAVTKAKLRDLNLDDASIVMLEEIERRLLDLGRDVIRVVDDVPAEEIGDAQAFAAVMGYALSRLEALATPPAPVPAPAPEDNLPPIPDLAQS